MGKTWHQIDYKKDTCSQYKSLLQPSLGTRMFLTTLCMSMDDQKGTINMNLGMINTFYHVGKFKNLGSSNDDLGSFFVCTLVPSSLKWGEGYLLPVTTMKTNSLGSLRTIPNTHEVWLSLSWCSCFHWYYSDLDSISIATDTSSLHVACTLCSIIYFPTHHSQYLWTFQGPDHILWHQRRHRLCLSWDCWVLISVTYLKYHTSCFDLKYTMFKWNFGIVTAKKNQA